MSEMKFCCDRLSYALDEADVPLRYNPRFREHGIAVLNGEDFTLETAIVHLVIEYCPWCGTRLPKSLRNEWFERLDRLGVEDADSEEVPCEMHTGEWWKREGL